MATIFLAQIWGPILLAVGLGLFTHRTHYLRVYQGLASEPLAGLTFGVFAMLVGLLQISIQHSWNTLLESLLTLLGWGTLVKGTLFLVAPTYVERVAGAWAKGKIPLAATLAVILGLYLVWIGYAVA